MGLGLRVRSHQRERGAQLRQPCLGLGGVAREEAHGREGGKRGLGGRAAAEVRAAGVERHRRAQLGEPREHLRAVLLRVRVGVRVRGEGEGEGEGGGEGEGEGEGEGRGRG